MKARTHARGPSAPGFTLIELLVVISIIGLMTGLIVVGVVKFRESGTNLVTDAQVTRYQRALDGEYNATVQKCHNDANKGLPDTFVAYCDNNVERAKAVHTAATLRINFPDSFAEATASFNIGGQPYNAKNTFASVGGVTGVSADEQRAILLYLVIKEKAVGGGTGDDSGAPGEQRVVTHGTKSFTLFVDQYGTPVVYSRWARGGELERAPYVPDSVGALKDPLDPRGLLSGWTAPNTTKRDTLNGAPYSLGFDNRNRVPTVVSAGKDKALDPGFGGDDRVGYRLARFGAKGDGK